MMDVGHTLKLALFIALVMNFIFGALVTLGIGNYAPSLVLFFATKEELS
jgi:hypothetical protein